MHIHTHAHMHIHIHMRTQTLAHTHIHTHKYALSLFSSTFLLLSSCASMTNDRCQFLVLVFNNAHNTLSCAYICCPSPSSSFTVPFACFSHVCTFYKSTLTSSYFAVCADVTYPSHWHTRTPRCMFVSSDTYYRTGTCFKAEYTTVLFISAALRRIDLPATLPLHHVVCYSELLNRHSK